MRTLAQLHGYEKDLTQPHGTIQQRWWFTEEGHIMQRGPVGHPRIVKPTLSSFLKVVQTAYERYKYEIEICSWLFEVSPEMILAVIVAESGGNPHSHRYEDHLGDHSFGLGQLLTQTASEVAHRINWNYEAEGSLLPRRSMLAGGDVSEWKTALADPATNLALTSAYIQIRSEENPQWFGDPITLYASYNAGGAYESNNAWGLHCAPAAIDTFRNCYNVAVDLVKGSR